MQRITASLRIPTLVAGVFLGTAFSAGVAQARVVLNTESQFKMELPDDWSIGRHNKSKDGKTHVAHFASADKNLRVRIRATPGTPSLKDALVKWEKEVLGLQTVEFKQDFASESDVAGRKSLVAGYTATMPRKKSVQSYKVLVTLIQAKRGFLYNLSAFVQESLYKAREAELTKVLGGFDLLGTAAPTGPSKPHTPPKPDFGGPTRVLADKDAHWTITVPADYVLERMSISAKGSYTARISSKDKNAKIMVRTRLIKQATVDFKAHWKELEHKLVKVIKTFESVREVPDSYGAQEEKGRSFSWKSFRGYGMRTTNLHPYRILAAALHDKVDGRLHTITISVHRDFFGKLEAVLTAIMQSFGVSETPPVKGK